MVTQIYLMVTGVSNNNTCISDDVTGVSDDIGVSDNNTCISDDDTGVSDDDTGVLKCVFVQQ